MNRWILLLLLTAVLFGSCTSTRKVAYFQGVADADIERTLSDYEVRIMPNDILYITVSALNPEAVQMFNSVNNTSPSVNAESLNVMSYLVDAEGNINFPIIGTVHVGRMTKTDVVKYIKQRVSDYVVDPTVNIRLLNYKVTVLGEVVRPGTFTIKDERISLPEALGLAGDMTIYGKRDNVLVCREQDGQKVFHRLDMTSPEVFSSEYFYLQQNDIVYVQPNKARAGSSSYNQNLSLGVSFLSLLVTIVAILI